MSDSSSSQQSHQLYVNRSARASTPASRRLQILANRGIDASPQNFVRHLLPHLNNFVEGAQRNSIVGSITMADPMFMPTAKTDSLLAEVKAEPVFKFKDVKPEPVLGSAKANLVIDLCHDEEDEKGNYKPLGGNHSDSEETKLYDMSPKKAVMV